ncbi:hypothetical protein RJ639_020505 [Escallonia herrerae]|uniref:TPX2 C-terminal domain-containing protein n=2 Tax=Escallonia herrerae TaxID=1293975 RepID=A0AA88V4V9_9ASTE|nr:hypothetical protein RJ639_020505 [Escallonia herrerae]
MGLVMGRDVAGLRIDKRPNIVNVKSNGVSHVTVHVAPRISGQNTGTHEPKVEGYNAKDSIVEECQEKQDELGAKSSNLASGLPEGEHIELKTPKSSEKNFSSPVKLGSGSAAVGGPQTNLSKKTPDHTIDKQASNAVSSIGAVTVDTSVNSSSNSNGLHSPNTAKKPQPKSPLLSRKPQKFDDRKHFDEEDNWSLASSAAASVRTVKSQITVPVAPMFKCASRAERRKEFYMKLEEKHEALKAEKMEYEARTKEEQEAAIKQLRKNMVVKANPVPSFYREGPPPKVELKKLPLTRATSPNLTRRKSCGDAVNSSREDKSTCNRAVRHSIGAYKEGSRTPSNVKSKDQIRGQNGNGTCKVKGRPKQGKETPKIPSQKMAEQRNADISVQS